MSGKRRPRRGEGRPEPRRASAAGARSEPKASGASRTPGEGRPEPRRASAAGARSEPKASGAKPLWAPWRLDYVEGYTDGKPPDKTCIFCDAPGSKPDRERLILHRGRHAIVRLNRYPYAPGHLMVSPVGHRARLADLESDARLELVTRLAQCERILEDVFRPDGLNVGANLGAAAGAGFADHLHFHVVPRWRGDVNFMTSIGEIRVIPAHIERSYERLLPAFQELDAR